MKGEGALLDVAAAAPFARLRVLVTGASGFLGWQVARQGLAAGVDVHCLGRTSGPQGTTFHAADLRDRDAVIAAVAELAPQVVLNLASPGVAFGTAEFPEIVETGTRGAEALLCASAALPKPPVFIHVGTGFEYADQERPIREDDPLVPSATPYGAAKAAASAVVGAFAGRLPIRIARPFNIYGAGDTSPRLGTLIIDEAKAGRPIDTSPGEQIRDFLHVDDCAAALWALAAETGPGHDFGVYNLGSGTPRSLRAYIEAVGAALAQHGYDSRVNLGAKPYRPGEPMIAVPDLTRLHRDFAWRPRTDFAAGIADFVAWSLR